MLKRIFNISRRVLAINHTDLLCILAGVIVFVIIAFWTITKSSIWFDEGFSAYIIHFNFIDIAHYTALDVHPPLYYWLLKLWSMLFGNTELGLRSMSVLFGGVSIIFSYLLVHRLFGQKVARISLLFIVSSPLLIRYSQEARMYTLMVAIALAATYVLTFAVNTNRKLPWIIYGILVGLGMWTHYFSVFIWIAHWVWRTDIISHKVKKSEFIKSLFSKEWAIANTIAVGMFIPWLPFFISQLFVVQLNGFWMNPVTFKTIPDFITDVIYYQYSGDVEDWLALGLFMAIILLAVLAFRVYKTQNIVRRQSYRLIMMLAFIPVLLLFILSMPPFRSIFSDRYLILSALCIALFVGVTLAIGLETLCIKWQIIIIVFMAGLMSVGVVDVLQLGNYSKDAHRSNMVRDAIEEVAYKAPDNIQPIIVDTPLLFYEATFYATDKHPVYFINDESYYDLGSLNMLANSDAHKIKNIAEFVKQNQVIWYLSSINVSDKDNSRAPYQDWQSVTEIPIYDCVTGETIYRLTQYIINGN
jgi:uncharacterized membrane protein